LIEKERPAERRQEKRREKREGLCRVKETKKKVSIFLGFLSFSFSSEKTKRTKKNVARRSGKVGE
jgi:hypothetical protein